MRLHSLFTSLFSLVSLASAQQAVLNAPRYPQNVGNWTGWGGNHYNNRWAMTNEYYSSDTIKNVVLHCQINSVYGVSATPSASGDLIYFPTWNGTFVALNYKTCDIQWQINVTTIINNYKAITDFDLYNHQPVSRTSPQIDTDNGILYFGTQIGALLVAVDVTNGNTLAVIAVNDHPVAQITASPTLYEGVIYVSTSSEEELALTLADYQCCSYVGNMGAFKFDPAAKSFTQLWNFETIGDSRNNGSLLDPLTLSVADA
jgi:outer membrane protein assembly factor BamB